MAIRCIAFDLDDTLWECQPVIARAEQRLYDWLQDQHPVITQRHSPTALVQHRIRYTHQYPELHHDLGLLRRQWLHQLALEHACPTSLVDPAFEVFWLARNQLELFPDVLSQLEKLGQRYQLGVITNGNADVHQVGIGHLFQFTLSSAEAGVAKPDPVIFHQALQKAGVAAHETVYVGDDPERDVIGAGRAGLRTIWVNRTQQEKPEHIKPDGVISNFAEISPLLDVL